MSDAAIRALVESNPGQATFEEYKLLYDLVLQRAPANLLVFGVGRDSGLWIEANAGGRTVFLEDVAEWAAHVRETLPEIEIHDIDYGLPRRFLWPILRRFERRLFLSGLPAEVLDMPWDVILVDGPRGTRWYRAGRMKSVYTAAVLAERWCADVFVHDCHRRVERESCDQFLGPERLMAQVGSMRHYRFA